MSNKVLVGTFSNRPQYTRQMLESLKGCIGIQNYVFYPFAEPICDETIELLKAFDGCETHVIVNPRRVGHTLNTKQAINYGFDKTDYVILIEEDQLFAKDFLYFHEFCNERFVSDEGVYSISAGHYHRNKEKVDAKHYFSYEKANWFHNQGVGWFKNRWIEKGGAVEVWENPEICFNDMYVVNYQYGGWDALINNIHRKNRSCVIPTLSRIKNIGAEGVHTKDIQKFKNEVEVKDWAGLYDLKIQEFCERR